MKQYIDVEQAEKDLGKNYEVGITWLEEHGYRDWHKEYSPDNKFMDIGMMIEFLDDNTSGELSLNKTDALGWYLQGNNIGVYPKHGTDAIEPIDALWEAVKEVLNAR